MHQILLLLRLRNLVPEILLSTWPFPSSYKHAVISQIFWIFNLKLPWPHDPFNSCSIFLLHSWQMPAKQHFWFFLPSLEPTLQHACYYIKTAMTSKLLNLISYLTRPLGSAGCWATHPSWSISCNGLPLQWPARQLLCWLVFITVQLHIHIPTALLCSPLGDLTQIYKHHFHFNNSVFYISGPAHSWTLGYLRFLLRCLRYLSQSLRTDWTLDFPSSSNLLLLASRILGNSNPTIQGAKAQNISIPSLSNTTSQWPSLLALPLSDPEDNHVTPSPVLRFSNLSSSFNHMAIGLYLN